MDEPIANSVKCFVKNGLLYLTPCAKDIQILPSFLSRQIANDNLGYFLQQY